MIRPSFILFLSLCLLCFITAVRAQYDGQGSKDLIPRVQESFYQASINPDSGLSMGLAVLKQAIQQRNKEAEAGANNSIAWNYFRKGQRDSAVPYFKEGLRLYIAMHNYLDASRVACNYAEMLTAQSRFTDALQYLLQADSFAVKANDRGARAQAERSMAILFREQKNYPRSSEYFHRAMASFKALQDTVKYVHAATSLAILYHDMKKYDSSIKIYTHCIGLADQIPDNQLQVAGLRENLAATYFAMGKYDAALKNFETAYTIFLNQKQMGDAAYLAAGVGKTYIQLTNYKLAEKYLLQSYALSDTLGMLNYKQDAARYLAQLYQTTSDWKKAFHYLQVAGDLQDSLRVSDQLSEIAGLQAKYEAEKKEKEISLLHARNQKNKWQQYTIIAVFLVSMVVVILLFNRYKMKRKLREQEVRNKIAADLHDDIGSALSGIHISSKIALIKKEDPVMVAQQLEKIQQQAHQVIDSISDIVWSINPANDSFGKMILRMKDFAATLLEPSGINFTFKESIDPENAHLDPDTRKDLYLVFKEAMNNAVKYSNALQINVSLKMDQHQYSMTIADNGDGFDTTKEYTGNGLKNMHSRMKQAGGELHIVSLPRSGTTVEAVVYLT